MKSMFIAVAVIAAGTVAASAQYNRGHDHGRGYDQGGRGGPTIVLPPPPPPPPQVWHRDHHPYAKRQHSRCHEKAHRLHHYERHASSDRVITPREREIMIGLRHDLDRSCGRYRWRG